MRSLSILRAPSYAERPRGGWLPQQPARTQDGGWAVCTQAARDPTHPSTPRRTLPNVPRARELGSLKVELPRELIQVSLGRDARLAQVKLLLEEQHRGRGAGVARQSELLDGRQLRGRGGQRRVREGAATRVPRGAQRRELDFRTFEAPADRGPLGSAVCETRFVDSTVCELEGSRERAHRAALKGVRDRVHAGVADPVADEPELLETRQRREGATGGDGGGQRDTSHIRDLVIWQAGWRADVESVGLSMSVGLGVSGHVSVWVVRRATWVGSEGGARTTQVQPSQWQQRDRWDEILEPLVANLCVLQMEEEETTPHAAYEEVGESNRAQSGERALWRVDWRGRVGLRP